MQLRMRNELLDRIEGLESEKIVITQALKVMAEDRDDYQQRLATCKSVANESRQKNRDLIERLEETEGHERRLSGELREVTERNRKGSIDLRASWDDANVLRRKLRDERDKAHRTDGCNCIHTDTDPQLFLVWKDGGSSPKKAHESFGSAQSEAARLAKANPGDRFYVLYAIGNASRLVADVQWVVSDARFDDRAEMPF
jgi:chromosome segregation ATPase